ncbi:hypothetical protein B0A49_07688 [Cryomyces minteri]|uniref:Uncharacterized protein n=1 Tax=Cryomyces minteri TaxID=331657 RepID=A0A4U0VVR3_9PEZI|nr:hypothetical protein B0A49_10722 [Cryomyces minteri]TKA64442.1 hypothetical protein B0A49_07688 [Cryomyces minteri]
MTSDRSSNGVRGLRAVFEHNEAASPDSRGRCPSNNGDSQPLSKVRTSFVSVEPVGQLGKAIGGMKGDSTDMNGVKEAGDAAVAVHADHIDGTMTNGTGSGSKQTTLPAETAPTAQPDKPVSAVEDADASMRPSDPKDEAAVSGGAALPPPAEDLLNKQLKPSAQAFATPGSSPRKPRKLRKPTTGPTLSEEDSIATALPAKLVSAAEEEGASVTTVELEGKAAIPGAGALPPQAEQPRDTQSEVPTDTPATPGSSLTNGTESHETPSGPNLTNVESAPNETNSAELQISFFCVKSGCIKITDLYKLCEVTQPNTGQRDIPRITERKAPVKASDSPHTTVFTLDSSHSILSSQTRDISIFDEERHRRSRKPGHEASAQTTDSSPAKHEAPPAPKTIGANHASQDTKSHRREPTRPVQLPSHLTAPTASSAAKHESSLPQSDGPGLARKPSVMSRNTSGSAALRSSTRSSKPPTQPSSKRSSLVKRSDSRANQQPQRPESRAGDAPARPAVGFLERMMRPTTSTASKTHDKTELKSPPRRTASVRTNGPKGTATGKRVNSRTQPALTRRNEGADGVNGHGTGGAADEGQGEVNNSTLGGILQSEA